MGFSIIHDLGPLTIEQRIQYLHDASVYFGLAPDLNALDAIWMDSGDGGRRLVAYARRGTTDLLREIHGIQVLGLTQHDGPGYVSFTATVRTKSGRQEMAVGAASTEGLKGDRLAAAVATAQTRALRRGTLQAVGGGILDESELNQTTTDINRSSVPLSAIATLPAPAPQPVVEVSAAPGKDVTKEELVKYVVPVDALGNRELPMKVGGQTQKYEYLVAPMAFSSGSIIPTDTLTVEQKQAEPAVEPKKRRGRKPKTSSIETQTDEFGTPYHIPETEPVKAEAPAGTLVVVTPDTITDKVSEVRDLAINPAVVAECRITHINEAIDSAKPATDMPTAAQTLEYKAELNKYTSVPTGVLSKAGMQAGPIGRVRAYAIKTFGVQPDASGKLPLTCNQWDTLLATFKRVSTTEGDAALVKLIESATA